MVNDDAVNEAVNPNDPPAPLVHLLGGRGSELPDPIPLADIPADVHRAYVVLTAAALRRVIADVQANPPESFADEIGEGLAAAGVTTLDDLYDVDDADLDLDADQAGVVRLAREFRAELNGMRSLEWRLEDIADAVLAQLLPFIHQQRRA